MANYLYYVGGADQLPSTAGINGAMEFSWFDIGGGSPGVKPSNTATIAAPGSPYDGTFTGDAYAGGGQSGAYNNNDNWTGDWNAAGFQGSPQVYVIGAVDADLQSDLNVGGQVNGFLDRTGTTQDLVCHHGAADYIVLAPGNVAKFGSQLDGTVLVWYCNNGALGEEANAIGLPFSAQNYPRGGDTDVEAAATILYQGCGILRVSGGNQEEYAWAAG